jgi:hypothetical protein
VEEEITKKTFGNEIKCDVIFVRRSIWERVEGRSLFQAQGKQKQDKKFLRKKIMTVGNN